VVSTATSARPRSAGGWATGRGRRGRGRRRRGRAIDSENLWTVRGSGVDIPESTVKRWEEWEEREREREKFIFIFLSSLVFCAGAIGGFVIVGQMLKDYGSCISFSNIINPKLKSQLLYCVCETCSTKLIMTTGYISQECKPCKQIVAKKRRIRKLDGNVRCWCVELLSPLE
jgi:hypothetical protein